MSAIAKRREGLFAFLMGSKDPNSPISLMDPFILEQIGAHRCRSVLEPVVREGHQCCENWVDPDDSALLHRGGFPDYDMPADVCRGSSTSWCRNGALHRDGDRPAIEYSNGGKRWYVHDKLHRDGDQPAVIFPNGTRIWYKNGRRHRDGGLPAVMHADGIEPDEYWINGDITHVVWPDPS